MNRIVFWLVLIAFGYLVWRFIQIAQRKNKRWRDQRRDNSAAAGSGASTSDAAPGGAKSGETAQLPRSEVMVRCARCGVYLPSSDALKKRDQVFCSAEHRDAVGP